MKKISSTFTVEPISSTTETFVLTFLSDPNVRQNLIGLGSAPRNFQRWLFGAVTRMVICQSTRPVGVVTLVGSPPRCFFWYALAAEFRGRGFSRMCLEAIEKHALTCGYKTITTAVVVDNADGQSSLKKAGYRRFRWMEKNAAG